MIRIIIFCRLYTDVPLFSVRDLHCKEWRTATSLRRFVHGWRIQWVILFLYLGGSIIYGLGHHFLPSRSTIAHVWYVIHLYCVLLCDTWDSEMIVCILVMQMPDVIAWLSNKTPNIKNMHDESWLSLFEKKKVVLVKRIERKPLSMGKARKFVPSFVIGFLLFSILKLIIVYWT
jgi:hypothetical protein